MPNSMPKYRFLRRLPEAGAQAPTAEKEGGMRLIASSICFSSLS
jgi:hypothetical protein